MKLGKIITVGLLGATAYLGYRAYQNRHQIQERLALTKAAHVAIQSDLNNIKKSLSTIAEQREHLQTISQDLSYKFRVFNQEAQAHIEEINQTLSKYKNPDNL